MHTFVRFARTLQENCSWTMTSAAIACPCSFPFLYFVAVADTHSITSIGQFYLQQQFQSSRSDCMLCLKIPFFRLQLQLRLQLRVAHTVLTDCRAISIYCFVLFYSLPPALPHLILPFLSSTQFTHSFFVVPFFANRFVAVYRRIYLFE